MNFDLRFYWKLFLNRFPVMALLVTLCTGLAVFTAARLPEEFDTTARLLVEEPQIPESMVASTVRTDAGEQLDIIQQRLLTRANLLDIANRFNVYEDLGEVAPDTIVSRMKQDTTIRRTARRDSATLMTISFRGRHGQIVADVVNEYVTIVLEANMNFRMTRAENTLGFFEQEVQRLGEELALQSSAIAVFKSENSSALPENQSYRLGRQATLQERVTRLEREQRALQAQRDDLENLFQATGQINQQGNSQVGRTTEQQQLLVSQTDLQQALLVYSAENPRVVRLQAIVDRLEAIIANQTNLTTDSAEGESPPISPTEVMFESSMIEIDNRLDALSIEGELARTELQKLEADIAASSINGAELDDLERDFQSIQSRYTAAASNLNQAKLTERIETTAQGQRISVIENANIPRLPSGPNRPRIVAMGAALGLGLAGGFFVLLELLNRSIRRPAELISKFNITPIATIPFLESKAHRTFRRLGLVTGSLIAIVGVPLALWYVDANYIPMDLLVQRVLVRVGLM
jgi:uncharacterized protein involved in exopolysaccharide biosynthesis